MAMLCGLGKTRLHTTKGTGRAEVANFKVIFQNLSGDTKQTTETRVVDFEDVLKRKQQC